MRKTKSELNFQLVKNLNLSCVFMLKWQRKQNKQKTGVLYLLWNVRTASQSLYRYLSNIINTLIQTDRKRSLFALVHPHSLGKKHKDYHKEPLVSIAQSNHHCPAASFWPQHTLAWTQFAVFFFLKTQGKGEGERGRGEGERERESNSLLHPVHSWKINPNQRTAGNRSRFYEPKVSVLPRATVAMTNDKVQEKFHPLQTGTWQKAEEAMHAHTSTSPFHGTWEGGE